MVQSCPRSLRLHVRDFSRKAYLMATRVSENLSASDHGSLIRSQGSSRGICSEQFGASLELFLSALLYL